MFWGSASVTANTLWSSLLQTHTPCSRDPAGVWKSPEHQAETNSTRPQVEGRDERTNSLQTLTAGLTDSVGCEYRVTFRRFVRFRFYDSMILIFNVRSSFKVWHNGLFHIHYRHKYLKKLEQEQSLIYTEIYLD